jgi:hypothetical protein
MSNRTIQSDPPALGAHNGFEVYPMPMFIAIETQNVQELASWYQGALGFATMFTKHDSNGQPVLIHLRRSKYQDILIRYEQSSSSGFAICNTAICFQADGEIDKIATVATAHPAMGQCRVDSPVDTPWNTRSFTVIDPEGRKLVFSHPRFDPQLTERMQRDFLADKLSRT